jgi:hypothetical protein
LSFPEQASRWATVHFGLLDDEGDERIWYNAAKEHTYDIRADMSHEKLLRAADELLPNDRLAIFFKIWCSAMSKTEMVSDMLMENSSGTALPENMYSIMLDQFVHIERGSVRLVFQDGDLDCHTFPLALRHALFVR